MSLGSSLLLQLLAHPQDLAPLLRYKLFHAPSRDLTKDATTGWERETMRTCWRFLEEAGRSYAAVIKELDGELARTICLFYLVLRALDTFEDDMTLDPALKQTLLREFHTHAATQDYSFTGSGPEEKDREILIQYPAIATELLLLPASSRAAILDIAQKMGNGMADFALRPPGAGLSTLEEYDLYCHYVAGLVGQGLSALFSTSGIEHPSLASELTLSNSFGLLLQKTNIIRDLREDADSGRSFYPRVFFAPHGFASTAEMCPASRRTEDVEQRAMWVQTAIVVDALRHATDALEYLRLLRNRSVFNFCAIPATMALATMELCFMNPAVFVRGNKIRKAEAVQLIMRSSTLEDVSLLFVEYARKMHAKARPDDPSFFKLSVACGKIEQWYG
ncbi:Squalene synthase [Mycena chlorophos]|uniref:Squalene synthase n=1 Tax=Mycena chlorophos TaxID=658473 RepID=A0A8H6WJ34_MYCCL|nr:Squalene synthase [Mycena chlorophos]